MAISIDALLAILLFIALIAFISIDPISEVSLTQPKVLANQLVDDAIATMDNTGFIMEAVESGNPNQIETKLTELLPNTVDYKLVMLQYQSNLDIEDSPCRTNKDFANCFPEYPTEFLTLGSEIPTNRTIFHSRKIFIKKEPGNCSLQLEPNKMKELSAYFLGSFAPKARDVNITTEGSCPGERSPCPSEEDTMRCCYEYFDGDGDPESEATFKWYKYNGGTDEWDLTGEISQTVSGQIDEERWTCSVSVSDGSEWSEETISPFAIIGGPCFQFSSSMTNTPMQCDQTSNISFTITGEAGERKNPVDIMLSMDKSGSMSWLGQYNATGTERSVFFDSSDNTAYLGTSDYVYKMDVDLESGALAYSGSRTSIDDARDVYVDGDYVFVANDDDGLTIIDKSDMSIERTIGSMTTARSVTVEGDYAYLGAAGTLNPEPIQVYGASMTGSRDDYERIGYSTTNEWVAQSFISDLDGIDGVRLELYRYDDPVGDLTVHLRETIDGADLPNGTVVVSSSSIRRNGYRWESIDFPDTVNVNIDQTYYIVLTTDDIDSTDYYRWGSRSRNSDPYADGSIYRCNTSDVCTAVEPTFQSQYEDARFRIYKYDYYVGGLVIVDKSDANPNNWAVVGNLYDTGSGLIDEPEDIYVSGDYAFVADSAGGDGTEGLWIVDISNKASPSMTGFLGTTNGLGVDGSGDYVYLADEDGGLRVINVQNKASPSISTTLYGTETVKDVFVYDSNVYAVSDTGSGATADGLHIVNITNPPTAYEEITFYSPYDFYKLFVGDDYAFVAMSYGLISVDRIFGPKINFTRNSGQEFVMFESWQSPLDKIGVSSYDSTGHLDEQLLDATQSNKENLISPAIGGIMAEGGTRIDLGLETTLDEILSVRGRADAVRFIILLADGQCNSGCPDLDAELTRAENNKVYIFSIGFGGDVDDAQMQRIADDAYCPGGAGSADCGAYHHIDDPDALAEIYAVIAQDIANLTGIRPDEDTTDISMTISGFSGLEISNFAPGVCSSGEAICRYGNTLSFEDLDIRHGWTGGFDAMIPCDYIGCGEDFVPGSTVKFPPEDTEVSFYIDSELQEPIQWPEQFISTSEFYYNDLTVDFLSGKFYGPTETTLEYRVSNVGYYDVDLTDINPTVKFYQGPTSLEACPDGGGTQFDSQNLTDALDAAYGDEADGVPTLETGVDTSRELAQSGWLCIYVNEEQDIQDCSENNTEIVICAVPKTFLYVLDYWVWEK